MASEVSTTQAPGAARGRWLIAIVVAGAALALLAGAVLLLGGRQPPEALGYVPADAVVVAELRLDLPGDQLQKVGNLLSHFPGFADQSTLGQKLDEAGDRLLGTLSDGAVSFTGDLKPWVSGPVFGAVRGIEPGPRLDPRPSWLFVATTNGAAGCAELFEGRITTSESYRDREIAVLEGGAEACVEDDRYVLAGDPESVRAGLDAQAGGTGLDGDARYRTAREALAGDQLGTLFVRGDALERIGDLPGMTAGPATLPVGAALPDWAITGVRADDAALIVDSVAAPLPQPSATPSLRSLAPAHPSELTRHVPGTALAYVEVQGAGAGIVNALTVLRAEPTFAEPLAELEQVLAAFGGSEKLLGWADDAGFIVVNDGLDPLGGLSGGVLLLAPDEATATANADNYRSLLGLAALGGVVELEATTIGNVEVTTVSVREAPALGLAEPLEFRLAVTGRVVVLSTSGGIMAALLETDDEGSLAASDAFGRAAARGLADPRTMAYVSVGQALAFEPLFLSPDQAADFTSNVKPYLDPIEAFHMSATEGPDGARARIVMIVTGPGQP